MELLRFDKDGNVSVVDREDCPLERRKDGGSVDAVHVLDLSGREVFHCGTPTKVEH